MKKFIDFFSYDRALSFIFGVLGACLSGIFIGLLTSDRVNVAIGMVFFSVLSGVSCLDLRDDEPFYFLDGLLFSCLGGIIVSTTVFLIA